MIIACPRCEVSYAVDVAVFGPRTRVVQCSACHYRWPQAGDADMELRHCEVDPACSEESAKDDSPAVRDSLPAGPGETAASDASSSQNLIGGETTAAAVATSADEDKPTKRPEAAYPPALSPDKAAAGASPPPEASTPRAAGPQLRPGGRILIAAMAAAATALLLVALLILLRGPVVASVPEAAKLYALVGLAPDPLGQGLEIRHVASEGARVGGRDVLKVTGTVANIVQSREPLPALRITLFDSEDQELQWTTVAPGESLDPGQSLRFEAEIVAPSPDARLLRVGFVARPN